MVAPIDSPTLALGVDDLVDWLELTALFDPYGVARLEGLLGSLSELAETSEDDIGERDRQKDLFFEKLENEVDLRRDTLGEAYPFSLGEGGEELSLVENWQDSRFGYYLICLVATHVSGSAILRLPPSGQLLTRLRNRIFQIVATLGVAGLSTGPAFSVGWPRQRGQSIVDLLTRAADAGGGFTVRNPPGAYVPPHEKDGGVDVFGWTAEATPPPSALYFGQTASGKNWPEKPVAEHARVFVEKYMVDVMTGNRTYVTMIPYRILDLEFWNSQHQFHRAILDRLRLPLRAWQGAQLAARGTPIDDAENVGEVAQWLNEYIDYAQAA